MPVPVPVPVLRRERPEDCAVLRADHRETYVAKGWEECGTRNIISGVSWLMSVALRPEGFGHCKGDV